MNPVMNGGTNPSAMRLGSAGCCQLTRPTLYCARGGLSYHLLAHRQPASRLMSASRFDSALRALIEDERALIEEEEEDNLGISGRPRRATCAKRVLGAVVVALIPWSAVAGDLTVLPKTPLRSALADVRTRNVAPPRPTAKTAAARRSEQSTNPATQSATFFKTRTGVIVAAVMAAGVGYAIYSAQHDRIHSAGKK